MIFLTKKKVSKLAHLLVANQIILNAYNNLDGTDQIFAYCQFCENTAESLFMLGGTKLLEEAKDLAFNYTDEETVE